MMENKLQFGFLTTQKIIQKIGQIDQFKGEWKQLDKDDNKYLKELRKENKGTFYIIKNKQS